jgi:hypothetical protein
MIDKADQVMMLSLCLVLVSVMMAIYAAIAISKQHSKRRALSCVKLGVRYICDIPTGNQDFVARVWKPSTFFTSWFLFCL